MSPALIDQITKLLDQRDVALLPKMAACIREAVADGKRIVREHIVIAVHGINTRGTWQKEIATPVSAAGMIPDLPDYDRYKIHWLRSGRRRQQKVEWFRKEYARIRKEHPHHKISVVAHSFGTYIVTKAMAMDPNIKFERMILCGSIVRRDYYWDDAFKKGQVQYVLNDIGGFDIPVRFSILAAEDMGWSGVIGFKQQHPNLRERRFPLFGHSDCFNALHFRDSWIPYLQGGDAGPEPMRAMPVNWWFRAGWGIVFLILAGVAWWNRQIIGIAIVGLVKWLAAILSRIAG